MYDCFSSAQMVDEKFEGHCWNNVVIAYTMCNEHDTSWRWSLEKKKVPTAVAPPTSSTLSASYSIAWLVLILPDDGDLPADQEQLQQTIQTKFPRCNVKVPVIALGGLTIEGEQSKEGGTPRRSARLGGHVAESDFDALWLWEMLQAATPLDTQGLQPFDGPLWEQYEVVVNKLDEAQAQMDAARSCMPVTKKLLLPVFILVSYCSTVEQ